MSESLTPAYPCIRPIGLSGAIVSFGDGLAEPANRAALAFAAAVTRAGWDGVEECAPSLVSVFVRADPVHLPYAELQARLAPLLAERDWYDAAMPTGRRFIKVPTVFGGEDAPQLEEAAQAAGLDVGAAVQSLTAAPVRVQTIGFAPGQPYLGLLPEVWNIPRQTDLTQAVPEGALVVAIRQLVVFSITTPTGWRHVGQTALQLYRPDSDAPFFLRPGDEVQFIAADRDILQRFADDPDGGAEIEVLT